LEERGCEDLDSPTEEVLSAWTPVKTHDPATTAREIGDLLAVLNIVKCDNPRVSSGSQKFTGRGESDCSYWLDETLQGVGETSGAVVEKMYRAVGVSRSRQFSV